MTLVKPLNCQWVTLELAAWTNLSLIARMGEASRPVVVGSLLHK